MKSVLQNAPVQGKAAFAQLKADLLQPSFPRLPDQVRTYLSKRYLVRLKRSLIGKLVTILVKEVVLQKDTELATVPENVANALIAIGEIYPHEYEMQLKDGLPEYVAGVDDERLWSVLHLLGNDTRVWSWLDEPLKIRIRDLVSGRVKGDQISYLPLAFAIPELAALLREKFDGFDDEKKEKFIAAVPAAELSEEAIRIFGESGGWRTAEARAKNLILPRAKVFTPDQIRRILSVTVDNGQIWDAGEIPEVMLNFYRLTKHVHETTREDWRTFLKKVKELKKSKFWDEIETRLSSPSG